MNATSLHNSKLQQNLWAFPVIYLGWAYLCWLPLVLLPGSVWALPKLPFFLAGGASPLLAAIFLAARGGGRPQLLDLGRRLIDYRRIGPAWWLTILLFWLVFDLLMAAIALLFGISERPVAIDWGLFSRPGPLLFLLLLSFVFPAVEEVGLRGFYLDALQERFGIGTAAILNGVTWAAWHTPFVWFPGYYENTIFNPSLSWWLPMIVCTTVLITAVYNGTRRSILAVLIFHGMMNFTGEALGIAADMYPFVLSGYVLLAALLLLAWRHKSAGTS